MFSTLCIISSEFWCTWCTLAHLTFGTPFGTLSVFVGTQVALWHTGIICGHFRQFGTPVAFGTLRIGSVFSTLGIIPSEFWYIWCTLVQFAFGTPVGTLSVLFVYKAAFFGTLGSFWVILGTIGTVITFGTLVAFW